MKLEKIKAGSYRVGDYEIHRLRTLVRDGGTGMWRWNISKKTWHWKDGSFTGWDFVAEFSSLSECKEYLKEIKA